MPKHERLFINEKDWDRIMIYLNIRQISSPNA